MPATKNGELRIRIEPDEDVESPRVVFDNVGTMMCWHRRCKLGDEQLPSDPVEWKRWLADKFVNFKTYADDVPAEHIERAIEKHVCVVLPLYLYEHSGITMNTTGFSCPWDSGQVGFIYITWESARQEWSGTDAEIAEQAAKCLRAEVAIYDQFLRDDLWGFIVERYDEESADWEEINSCWGFYGSDPYKNGMIDHWTTDEIAHFEKNGFAS